MLIVRLLFTVFKIGKIVFHCTVWRSDLSVCGEKKTEGMGSLQYTLKYCGELLLEIQ